VTAADETAGDERLADLRGFLMRELARAQAAGAEPADLIACLCDALGETLAATGRPDVSPLLPVLAAQVRQAHRRALARRAAMPAAWRGDLG
jgi:hypothetical protein